MTDRPIVSIQWLDSKGVTSSWEHIDELEPLEPVICTSVGFIIDETDSYVTLVQSVSEEQILARLTIPKCAITLMQALRASQKDDE